MFVGVVDGEGPEQGPNNDAHQLPRQRVEEEETVKHLTNVRLGTGEGRK